MRARVDPPAGDTSNAARVSPTHTKKTHVFGTDERIDGTVSYLPLISPRSRLIFPTWALISLDRSAGNLSHRVKGNLRFSLVAAPSVHETAHFLGEGSQAHLGLNQTTGNPPEETPHPKSV